MKTFIFIILTAVASFGWADDQDPEIFKIINRLHDGKTFDVNLHGDGVKAPDGVKGQWYIVFDLMAGESLTSVWTRYIIGIKGIGSCLYSTPIFTPIKNGGNRVEVHIDASSLGIDDGSSCDYVFETNYGRKYAVTYYLTGT